MISASGYVQFSFYIQKSLKIKFNIDNYSWDACQNTCQSVI